MQAEIVIVGDEILSGRVVDTNSALVARLLSKIGIGVQRVVRVGDDERAIGLAVAAALVSSRLVLVIGGLGPTPDDRTLAAVCRVLDRKIVQHQPTLARIQAVFRQRGMKMPALAARQALVPEGAEVFPNPVGMVPGMVIEHQGSLVVLLPGVPQELEALLQGGLLAYLQKRAGGPVVYQRLVRTFGLVESKIAPRIMRFSGMFPGVAVGFYPRVSGLDILFTGEERTQVERVVKAVVAMLGSAAYAIEDKELAEVVGELLRQKGLTIATAESCTGGLVGDLLTNVPGSSDYYQGGVVAYRNSVKMKLLGVREKTLIRYGAVSRQTVEEMARGVCRLLGTDVGIAVSGIAGPGGATEKKPVGLVYIGVALQGKVQVERYRFSGSRRLVKERSAWTALDLCRRVLAGLKS